MKTLVEQEQFGVGRIKSSNHCTIGEDLEKHVRRCVGEIKEPFDHTRCFYGVGNHGGGPTRECTESILRLNADPEFPELTFDTPDGFFERASTSGLPFPTVHNELQHHAVGCYSAHSGVKCLNRRAENALNLAEKFCSAAQGVTGQGYPEDFDLAWKAMLFNQFHDFLAGTSLEAAYEDARDGFGEAMSIAGRNLNYALQSISWSIGIEQNGTTPIVVFNPHFWPGLAGVESEFGSLTGDEVLLDEEDRPIPLQTVRSYASTRGRNRIGFVVHLPAMGYRVYRVASGPSKEGDHPLQADESSAEDDRFRLVVDPATCFVSSLYDKERQVEVFGGPAARPVVLRPERHLVARRGPFRRRSRGSLRRRDRTGRTRGRRVWSRTSPYTRLSTG